MTKLNLNKIYILAAAILVAVNLAFAGILFKDKFTALFRHTPVVATDPGVTYPELAGLKNQTMDFSELKVFFTDIAKKKGGAYAYKELAFAASNSDIPANTDLHLLGHAVGDVLYQQQGIDGIKVCTQDLRNACSHSIVVGYLLDHGSAGLGAAVETCHGAPGGSGAYTMCVHGLGHGVLAYTDYDMKKAVDLCKLTGTAAYGYQETAQCVGGVTMEMMSGVHDTIAWAKQKPNYLKPNDPLAPCDMDFITGDAINFCYTYLTPHLFEAAGADIGSPDPKYFKTAISYCDKISNTSTKAVCYASFGKEFVAMANARNIQSVVSMNDEQLKTVYTWCAMGPVAALSPCVDSALQSLYWGGENDSNVSVRFCSVIPDQGEAGKCMDSLINAVAYYIGDNAAYKDSFCKQLPDSYQGSCKSKLLSYE